MVQRGRDTWKHKNTFLSVIGLNSVVPFYIVFDFQAVSFGGGFALVKVWGFEDTGLEILGMLEI